LRGEAFWRATAFLPEGEPFLLMERRKAIVLTRRADPLCFQRIGELLAQKTSRSPPTQCAAAAKARTATSSGTEIANFLHDLSLGALARCSQH